MKNITLIDAHVHLHDVFDTEKFLMNARHNFKLHLEALKVSSPLRSYLLLTEGRNETAFEKIKEISGKKSLPFNIDKTNEEESLRITFAEEDEIIVVSGKQIVTAEKLEVLALGTKTNFEEDNSIVETIKAVTAKDALPVVPWGFGKWTGKRKKIIQYLMTEKNLPLFYLGDNSGRIPLLKGPEYYLKNNLEGKRILPGSDPLPFKNQIAKPGSYGFYIDATPDSGKPFEFLRKYLANKENKIYSFGKLESLHNFLHNQIYMQIKKRI